MKKKPYEVEVPIKGILYFHVEAASAAEAMRIVNSPSCGLCPVENILNRTGKARSAKEIENPNDKDKRREP